MKRIIKYRCIIFDCDGVLVDSESISAKVFQKMAKELGFEMDFETAAEQFAGTSMKDNLEFIQDNIEEKLPDNFEKEFRKRTYEVFKTELKPVEGISDLLDRITIPFCVASSGPIEKIRLNLTITGLINRFEGKIFSSYDIGSWKPEPGIFLHAANKMGFKPSECLVIEDSEAGIKAAKAGGFDMYARATEKRKKLFEKLGATVFFHVDELTSLLKID
jgi:HAD superfamily hydrolase (TIGR01509 family)